MKWWKDRKRKKSEKQLYTAYLCVACFAKAWRHGIWSHIDFQLHGPANLCLLGFDTCGTSTTLASHKLQQPGPTKSSDKTVFMEFGTWQMEGHKIWRIYIYIYLVYFLTFRFERQDIGTNSSLQFPRFANFLLAGLLRNLVLRWPICGVLFLMFLG